ncbi:hypothetical protein EVAR_76529_1 [Eumeta japonica]|uniref:Uncharacterized protein n=1 Tax=Eumeta variegata TaxID=151549 RepID=A0A4C1T4S5_EUMVA|nr:hypothetical protein EVAR_76529_1 [Eumeta japonica]
MTTRPDGWTRANYKALRELIAVVHMSNKVVMTTSSFFTYLVREVYLYRVREASIRVAETFTTDFYVNLPFRATSHTKVADRAGGPRLSCARASDSCPQVKRPRPAISAPRRLSRADRDHCRFHFTRSIDTDGTNRRLSTIKYQYMSSESRYSIKSIQIRALASRPPKHEGGVEGYCGRWSRPSLRAPLLYGHCLLCTAPRLDI